MTTTDAKPISIGHMGELKIHFNIKTNQKAFEIYTFYLTIHNQLHANGQFVVFKNVKFIKLTITIIWQQVNKTRAM